MVSSSIYKSFILLKNNDLYLFHLEYSFLYEEKAIKSLSNIINTENTCGYITCVTTPTKYEKSLERSAISGKKICF